MKVIFDKQSLEQIKQELRGLPKKEKPLTAAAAVALLKDELHALRQGGYGEAELQQLLAIRGLKVSRATLQRALASRRIRRARRAPACASG